jgi:hypothetical protein
MEVAAWAVADAVRFAAAFDTLSGDAAAAAATFAAAPPSGT